MTNPLDRGPPRLEGSDRRPNPSRSADRCPPPIQGGAGHPFPSRGIDRRTFLSRGAAAGLGLGVLGSGSPLWKQTAPSDRVLVAVMGVNSRGHELARAFARMGAEVAYVCDVDSRAVETTIAAVSEPQEVPASESGEPRTLPPLQARRPRGVTDFRRALDDPEVTAVVMATPDHWHAPGAMMALQAGKHVYLEKPCSHNPREGELLVEAQRYHGLHVQMGNQQRSAPESIEAMEDIRSGLIGRPYYGRSWYANTRGPIGRGRVASVPGWLDYELWQGPAPRTPYRDNVVHYNWHWFWRWGTGEICNNGTHEIDVCRWALGVDYPIRVTSAGGRYHYDDDWECPDTQMASFDFEGGKTITWEGRSCSGRPVEGRSRGAAIHGTEGTLIIDRSGYLVYDNDNNEIKRRIRGETDSALDTRGGGSLTDLHILNFLAAIQGDEELKAPVHDGRMSQLLCHLGNIAQRTGWALQIDPATGRIQGDEAAMELWSRDYEPGWEPRI